MIVYVESNFVLELALLQEQHESCEKIIDLAEIGKVSLVVPAYSLIEPVETLNRYAKNRIRISDDLTSEVKQLSRSRPYDQDVEALRTVTGFLIRSLEDEKSRLQRTVERLLKIAEIVPMDATILNSAEGHRVAQDLSPQDAIVYASVLAHLSGTTDSAKCFLNRNSRDFDDPDIQHSLGAYGCKILFRFDKGFGYIANKVSL